MANARIFKPENRLAQAMGGGQTAADLIAAADARIAALQPAVRSYVDEHLKRILRYATASEDVLFSECRELGRDALAVAEVAGAAGLETIGEITRGINAMVQSLTARGIWHTGALRLHLSALALVSQAQNQGAGDNSVMLNQLHAMRASLGIDE